MSNAALRPRTLVPGFALGSLATLALGLAAPRPAAPADVEYKILIDVEDKELKDLAKDGWEYAGYLGTSIRGANADESLWRRVKD